MRQTNAFLVYRPTLQRAFFAALLWLLLAAACTSEPEDLPTLAQIPTDAAQLFTLTPTAAPTSAAPDPEEAQVTIERTIPATFTATATVTVTASQTITDTPSPTASDIPTLAAGARPLSGLLDSAIQATILPEDFFPPDLTPLGPPPTQIPVTVSGVEVISTTVGGGNTNPIIVTPITPIVVATNPASNCQYLPPGGFGTIIANNPDIAAQIGCPLGNPPMATFNDSAIQLFQQGQMQWVSPSDMYALYSTGTYQYYPDTFVDGSDPENSSEQPPQGSNLQAPVRGFLKVWANNPEVRSGLGWATADEEGLRATVQEFANGRMIWLEGRGEILVLIGSVRGSGMWRTVAGRY